MDALRLAEAVVHLLVAVDVPLDARHPVVAVALHHVEVVALHHVEVVALLDVQVHVVAVALLDVQVHVVAVAHPAVLHLVATIVQHHAQGNVVLHAQDCVRDNVEPPVEAVVTKNV